MFKRRSEAKYSGVGTKVWKDSTRYTLRFRLRGYICLLRGGKQGTAHRPICAYNNDASMQRSVRDKQAGIPGITA